MVWVTIHRMDGQTLRRARVRLLTEDQALDARAADLRSGLATATGSARAKAQKQLDRVLGWQQELRDFLRDLRACAEEGPSSTGKGCPEREVDAPYDPDLDDGVMINSAALWPLLTPQWTKPKQWWKELASAKGRKDYDWAHLAARYFPERVDAQCQKDPSLGVAHGCFWRYHTERAWAWELRLGLEIEPGFTIDEADSDSCRQAFLDNEPAKAVELLETEVKRRHRKDKELDRIDVHLPVAGVWDALGKALVDLEVQATRHKSHKKPVTFPEPEGGREAWLAQHPQQAQRIEQAHREVTGNQGNLF